MFRDSVVRILRNVARAMCCWNARHLKCRTLRAHNLSAVTTLYATPTVPTQTYQYIFGWKNALSQSASSNHALLITKSALVCLSQSAFYGISICNRMDGPEGN